MSARVLASEISGRLVHQGRPLSGVVVTRTVWDGEPKKDQATTDSAGAFSFARLPKTFSWKMVIPAEVVNAVALSVPWNGAEVQILSYTKRDFDPLTEFGGRAVRLELDPAAPRFMLDFGDGVLSRSATARLSPSGRQALGAIVRQPINEAEAERLKRLFE
jgi:hypothetical protein